MKDDERRKRAAGAEASRVMRQRRSELRTSVMVGVPLSEVLREHGTVLRSVPIDRLVQWQPQVGDVRARRILKGLPVRLPLGDLDVHQRALFALRVVNYERGRVRPHRHAG